MAKKPRDLKMVQGRGSGIGVSVRNNNVDMALKILKKKVKNSKLLLEYKNRMEYTKPSEKRRRERALRKRRSSKYSKPIF